MTLGSKDAAIKGKTLLDASIVFLYSLGLFGFAVPFFLERWLSLSERSLTVPFRFLVLGAALTVLGLLLASNPTIHLRGYMLPLGFFWLLYMIRLGTDVLVLEAPLPIPVVDLTFFVLGMTFVPMLAFLHKPGKGVLARCFKWNIGTLLVSVCFMLPNAFEALRSDYLTAGDLFNPITRGHLGAALAALAIYKLMGPVRVPVSAKIVYLFCSFLGILTILISAKRGPTISFVAMMGLIVVFSLRNSRGFKAVVGGWFLACSLPLIYLASSFMGSPLISRLLGTVESIEEGTAPRLLLWESAANAFLESPLLGWGVKPPLGVSPHNMFLEAFMATGILGGLTLLILVWLGFLAAIRLVWSNPAGAWIGVLFFGQLTAASFSGALWNNPVFWYLLAASLTLCFGPIASVLSGKFAVLIRDGFSLSVRRATQECRESFEAAQQSCRRKDARSSGVNFPDSTLVNLSEATSR